MATNAKMGPIYKGAKILDVEQVVFWLRITDVISGVSVEEMGNARIFVRGNISLTSDFLASKAFAVLKALLEPRDSAVAHLQSREEPVLVSFYSCSTEYRKEVDGALLCPRDHAYQQAVGHTWAYEGGDLPWDEVRPREEEPELPYPSRR